VSERLFTRAQAEALLPRLRPLLESAREAAEGLAGGDAAQAMRAASGGNGGGNVARGLIEAGGTLRHILEEISSLGVVVRDPSTGLVDFPAERQGRPVFLCWRLGEDAVEWWHDRSTGFAGRQRLEDG
jgi:hypothetical protein